jgi:hypothetical protein
MDQTRTWLHYRREAQRVRQPAEIAASPIIRDQLLAIAEQFDQLAESAESAAKHFGGRGEPG